MSPSRRSRTIHARVGAGHAPARAPRPRRARGRPSPHRAGARRGDGRLAHAGPPGARRARAPRRRRLESRTAASSSRCRPSGCAASALRDAGVRRRGHLPAHRRGPALGRAARDRLRGAAHGALRRSRALQVQRALNRLGARGPRRAQGGPRLGVPAAAEHGRGAPRELSLPHGHRAGGAARADVSGRRRGVRAGAPRAAADARRRHRVLERERALSRRRRVPRDDRRCLRQPLLRRRAAQRQPAAPAHRVPPADEVGARPRRVSIASARSTCSCST